MRLGLALLFHRFRFKSYLSLISGFQDAGYSGEDGKNSAKPNASANSEPDAENAYASFQGLLALARITGSNANEARGACKKCGRVGHLTFQCRNFLSVKDDKDKDPEAIEAAALAELDKLKGNVGKLNGKSRKNAVGSSEESDEEDDSEDSDSDADSEIERIIAERSGKKLGTKGRSLRKKKDSDIDEHRDSRERKKRGRSKKRSGKRGSSESDDSDGGKKKRKERRRKRDESSDDDYEQSELARAEGTPHHLILMQVALMIHGLVGARSDLRRRAGNAVMMRIIRVYFGKKCQGRIMDMVSSHEVTKPVMEPKWC
ncbi:hypothetical protein CMV_011670 [Castanea mollissima]|uniref:CCHC-type domain-containing protein n=1 Tax=Castanea mollissima TaxID=60419 RepID=A0A8J4VNZ5_9ROSI|nr:hypothetical protein CMV_011670 [Castanea mollissima]